MVCKAVIVAVGIVCADMEKLSMTEHAICRSVGSMGACAPINISS